MNKLLLVDGSNLLFQMFFGMPSRIVNSMGKPIHGTLGFTGALLKIIRMIAPSHIAVLFDAEHGTERHLTSPEYKANRPDYSQTPEEETPFSQLGDIYKVLDHLDIRHAETVDCEVDDWIAAYSEKYRDSNEIFIMSFDSDFFQLITDKVSVIRYRGNNTVTWTPTHVQEKFNIPPALYADMKTLTGDSADNIKGIKGIGVKTAAQLLNKFGSIESILANSDSIQKVSIRDSIKKNADLIKQNYALIKLNGKHRVPFILDDMIYHHSETTSTAILKELGIF